MPKKELRSQYLNIRQALNPSYRYNATVTINQLLFSFVREQNYSIIASYLPIGSELDLTAFNNKIGRENCTLLFPNIVHDGIVFAAVNSKQHLVPELIIMPSVCFDRNRYRLGYGKAYYDRALNAMKQQGIEPYKVIANFSQLMVNSIHADPWDVSAECVLHEEGIF